MVQFIRNRLVLNDTSFPFSLIWNWDSVLLDDHQARRNITTNISQNPINETVLWGENPDWHCESVVMVIWLDIFQCVVQIKHECAQLHLSRWSTAEMHQRIFLSASCCFAGSSAALSGFWADGNTEAQGRPGSQSAALSRQRGSGHSHLLQRADQECREVGNLMALLQTHSSFKEKLNSKLIRTSGLEA